MRLTRKRASSVAGSLLAAGDFLCFACGTWKPRTEFSKDRSRKSGLQNKCKTCYAEYQRAWSAANRDTHNAVRANWIKKNNAKWRGYVREWRRNNPDLNAAHVATRRSARRNATPTWADKNAIKDVYRRARELTLATGIKHSVDHIVPLCGKTVCGLHVEHNLQVLTTHENSSKHNKLLDAI